VPEALMVRMRASACVWLELPLSARVTLLIEDYAFFLGDPEAFCAKLEPLRVLRGNEIVDRWHETARAGHADEVVRDLLVSHYDPIYLQSMKRNFPGLEAPVRIEWDGSAGSLRSAALDAIAASGIAAARTRAE